MVQNINLEQFDDPAPDHHSHGGCGSCGTGKAAAGQSQCGNGLEKIYPTTAVRFGFMRYIGEFTHAPEMKFTCGAKVVIQTRRGIEMGEQVSLTCNGCDKSVTRDQMREWVATCGEDSYLFDAGRILREATAADLAEYVRIQQSCRQRRDFSQQLARRLNLPMRIVDCECPFGGERILYYFTANDRVDFRALVKELADEYRTRIEMRQVGARDEARLLADFETCGREVCCKVFLKTLRPISMRMAKLQKATLDPSQVSGRCGRLKCCLRYEHVGYEELDKSLPRVGLRVRTNHGDGVIVNRQILTQLIQIRTETGDLVTVVAEDILELGGKEARPSPSGPDAAAEPQTPGRAQRDRGSPRRPSNRPNPRAPLTAPRFPNQASPPSGPDAGAEPLDSTREAAAEGVEPNSELDMDSGSTEPTGQGQDAASQRSRRRRGRRRPPPMRNSGSPPTPEPPTEGHGG